ncbi:hypothetical protein J6590_027650 [Homalodisca vitripennis]|nr:hypothetical protein J6590_027650 [Homalodisca vitripennis]
MLDIWIDKSDYVTALTFSGQTKKLAHNSYVAFFSLRWRGWTTKLRIDRRRTKLVAFDVLIHYLGILIVISEVFNTNLHIQNVEMPRARHQRSCSSLDSDSDSATPLSAATTRRDKSIVWFLSRPLTVEVS